METLQVTENVSNIVNNHTHQANILSDNSIENSVVQSETIIFKAPILLKPITATANERRKSIRLHEKSKKRILEETIRFQTIIEQPPSNQHIRKTKKPSRISILSNYFDDKPLETALSKNSTATSSKKSLKSKHKDGVLRLLNSGTIKEVQILPRVGLKTAYQIVTNRIINGSYKNFQQLEKLPFWRGGEYKRFITSNNLD